MPSFLANDSSVRRDLVTSSNLLRWSGLAALIAGVLFVLVNLITLLVMSVGQGPFDLLIRAVISPLAGTLLLLGLVGLYIHQAEVTDVIGLTGFLLAFFSTGLAMAGNAWANLLADLGWALFGVSSFQARVYPPATAILLVIGALLAAPFSVLVVGGISDTLAYASVVANTILDIAIVWLGYALFTVERDVSAEQRHHAR
jgi:hypothetical protein